MQPPLKDIILIDLYSNNFELYDKWCIKKKTHTVMVWFVLTILLLPFAGDLFLISKNEIIQIGCKILLISHHIFITLLSINLVNIILQTKKKARSFVSKLREVLVKWVKSTK